MKNNYSDDEDENIENNSNTHNISGEEDNHREEEGGEDSQNSGGEKRKKGSNNKKKQHKKDNDEEFVDSSEEDEDEDLDQYQYDDFVVDREEDEDEDEEGTEKPTPEERARRKEERRKRREEREKKKSENKLHRLKKLRVDRGDVEGGDLKDSLSQSLFGDDVDGDDNMMESEKIREDNNYDMDEGSDEDEMDDFVVDSNNKPLHHRRKSKSNKRSNMYDIFGDEDIPAEKPKDALSLIREQYEPSLLEEKHFTDADEEIRKKNLPERLQTRKGTVYIGEKQIYEEAEWIYEMAYSNKSDGGRDLRQIETISSILKFIQRDSYEVPYIYTYKKDIFEPYFTLQDLWTIFDLDEKWAHLVTSKRNLETVINNNQRLEHYLQVVRECKLEEGISDLYDLFQVLSGPDAMRVQSEDTNGDVQQQQQPRLKRAIKRDLYTVFAKAGLCGFLPHYGMSAQEFGINLMDNFMTNMPTDHSEDPSTAALQFICLEADTMEEVLKATRYLMAHDIGFDPNVRQSIRVIYRRYAYITTIPTQHGYKEIDAFHPYITVKNIREKPFHLFDDTQYLLILKAEKEGFIKTSIGIPSNVHESTILPEMEALYLSDGTSSISQQWNKERRQIIADALTKFLYPLFEKEIRNKLLTEASNRVAFECAKALEEKLRVAPWQPEASNDEDEDEDDEDYNNSFYNKRLFKVMTFCWGSGKVPTMGVILDSDSEVVTHAKFDFLCDRVGETMVQGKKQDDVSKLHALLKQHQPRLILVSATEMESRQLFDEIRDQVTRLTNDGVLKRSTQVFFSNPEIGLALQSSAKMAEEFREYPSVLKHAIAIGRCVLDPLTEYANLCTDANEILYLKLHPLQDMIGKDYLLKLLHRCFINVVNAVGVDVNKFIKHKFASSPLQFVSGLGSRKAQALLNSIVRRGGYVSSRPAMEKLLNNQDIVYKNCIGFIQIREKYFEDDRFFNPLDDTRIHPEDYTSAYKIAADALDKPADQDYYREDSTVHEYIQEIMRKPKKLDTIDFEAFADILESRNNTQKKKVLYMIKAELTSPFADIRNYYRPPLPGQVFSWLTGDTDATFREGTLVTVTTIRNSDQGVRCRLENALEAVIPPDCISDNGDTKSFPRGTTLSCRVQSIDKERFNVMLTCRASDMDISRWEDKIYHELKSDGQNKYLNLDPTPPPAASNLLLMDKSKPDRRPVPKKEPKQKRNVVHPLWKSMNFVDAEKYLKEKPVGEAILRPSSRGYDHITVTFKFWDGIILHHDIKEADKPNAVSLGKSFYMGETKYDSLDEILARHVEYLINNLNEVRNHRHWRDGSKTIIDEEIRREKAKYPKTIPYHFGISTERPGCIILFHVPSTNPRHEFILVKSEGFEMRKKTYATIDELIKYFKNNYAQILQSRPQSSGAPIPGTQRLPSSVPQQSSQQSSSSQSSYNNNSNNNYKPNYQQQNNTSGGYGGNQYQPSQQQQPYQSRPPPPQQYQQQPPPPPQYQPPSQPPYQSRPPPPQQQGGWSQQPPMPYGQQAPPYGNGAPRHDNYNQPPPPQQYGSQQQRYDNRNDYRSQQPPQQSPYHQPPPPQQYQQQPQPQFNRYPNQQQPPYQQQQQQPPYQQHQSQWDQPPQQQQQNNNSNQWD